SCDEQKGQNNSGVSFTPSSSDRLLIIIGSWPPLATARPPLTAAVGAPPEAVFPIEVKPHRPAVGLAN
ncbi:MAG TPA: hypothetical protein PKM06_11330, partial [Bacillota bacterium]|nr:hypothetical protein [Bacillota bacterium]